MPGVGTVDTCWQLEPSWLCHNSADFLITESDAANEVVLAFPLSLVFARYK